MQLKVLKAVIAKYQNVVINLLAQNKLLVAIFIMPYMHKHQIMNITSELKKQIICI